MSAIYSLVNVIGLGNGRVYTVYFLSKGEPKEELAEVSTQSEINW